MSGESPEHVRHRPPISLPQPRPVVVACPQFKSAINLSRIVRLAGCCGVPHVIACGNNKIDSAVARDAPECVQIERRRSLPNRLRELKESGYRLVGLEQTTHAISLHEYRFPRQMALVVGHERIGIDAEVMPLLDDVVEIPVYGLPFSYNVATATTMALYEYCKQYPQG
ncbi:MAG: TrmH family RNA methyltransferase [Pirellulaceae bacterium]|nr:TrmH family RNA methyltransferase [Pirellulaceae bacterium]